MYIFLYIIACRPRLEPSSGRQRLAPGHPPRGYAARMPNHVFIHASLYPSVKGSLKRDPRCCLGHCHNVTVWLSTLVGSKLSNEISEWSVIREKEHEMKQWLRLCNFNIRLRHASLTLLPPPSLFVAYQALCTDSGTRPLNISRRNKRQMMSR